MKHKQANVIIAFQAKMLYHIYMPTRRNLLAALLAPVVARWWPEPKATTEEWKVDEISWVALDKLYREAAMGGIREPSIYVYEIGRLNRVYKSRRLIKSECRFDPKRLPA